MRGFVLLASLCITLSIIALQEQKMARADIAVASIAASALEGKR